MGMAAPGVEVDREEDLAMETALERSQRPSTRPTTACDSRARTGEPLWPSVTGWLRRKTSAAGADFSRCVDSYERTSPEERSSLGTSKVWAFWSFGGRSERAMTDWPRKAGSGESGRKGTLWLPAKGFGMARRTATSCSESTAMMAA